MDAKHCITTYQNIRFDPLQAGEADIRIGDIAHALSLICRANGHFKAFYSVAQHSVHCALEAAACGLSRQTQLHCLMHDAAEAYLGDVTRPVKRYFPLFGQAEELLQRTIYRALGVDPPTELEQREVRRIDDRLLYHEFLMYHGSEVWDKAPPLLIALPAGEIPHREAEEAFLRLFDALKG
ncbi:MAG TPA: phosphohydrolase [Feifaniaceae bacterium]|nr:phosphohydrolase [Feifaniaceae bacterium]